MEPLLTLNKVTRQFSVPAKTIPRRYTIKNYVRGNTHNMSLIRVEKKFGYYGGIKFSIDAGGDRRTLRYHEGALPPDRAFAGERYPYHFVCFRVTDFRSCYQGKEQ
jgi:hypothetical protein